MAAGGGHDVHPPQLEARTLTPRQRFRHWEPSLFINGHMTSLLASEVENELVREDLGGMALVRHASRFGESGMELSYL